MTVLELRKALECCEPYAEVEIQSAPSVSCVMSVERHECDNGMLTVRLLASEYKKPAMDMTGRELVLDVMRELQKEVRETIRSNLAGLEVP